MNNATKPAHLPTPAFLLEVHTERFVDVMQALESAGFEVAARAGHSARYVLRDSRGSGVDGGSVDFI